ncbi:hypothetical protein LTR15_001782 [Elasticomyces elasticus]|nr:hypothetical protein LTR15_001782 [Elasticomyces elasticus]
MSAALTGLFNLRWSQQHPQLRPLPAYIERIFVPTSGGDLELLICRPVSPSTDTSAGHKLSTPPVFFAHGGFGSAGVWLEWMEYLHSSGYQGTLYACSLRNHGASYSVRYFRMVWQTSLADCAADLVSCTKHAQADAGGAELVLVGHSAGGGLAQYVLAKAQIRVRALCLVDAIPHHGSLEIYKNWLKHDPWFPLHSMLHLGHPNSPLSSVELVRTAFLGSRYPVSRVPDFMKWMPGYESMGWPMGMLGDFPAWWGGQSRWLGPGEIVRNIVGSARANDAGPICILVGSEDMMFHPAVYTRQVVDLSRALSLAGRAFDLKAKQQEGGQADNAGVEMQRGDGVRLLIVQEAGHHVQNDVQTDAAVQSLCCWLEQL